MIYLLAYVVGGLLCWFPFARAVLRSLYSDTPSVALVGEDYLLAIVVGGALAFIWPLAFVGLGAAAVLKRQSEEPVEIPPHDTSMW